MKKLKCDYCKKVFTPLEGMFSYIKVSDNKYGIKRVCKFCSKTKK